MFSSAASSWPSGQIANNLVHAFASREFVAYMINLQTATSDAALALPVDVLNTDYVVIDRTQAGTARFTVFAPFDDTQVTFTPTVAISVLSVQSKTPTRQMPTFSSAR